MMGADGLRAFQFTHPGGVRLADRPRANTIDVFQFTHPGGVRHYTIRYHYDMGCFNSRTREGCDIPFK